MSSTGVNVLRWSALGFGVFFGFSHQRSITATRKSDHAKHEYDHKQKLIDQAKAQYAAKKAPASGTGDDAALDVNSPSFDLEKLLLKVSAENP